MKWNLAAAKPLKTRANPGNLAARAQKSVEYVNWQLCTLSSVLATMERVLDQDDVTDHKDIAGQLRWVQYELDHELSELLAAVRTQAGELVKRLELQEQTVTSQISIKSFPERFQEDMDQTMEQMKALYHSPQPVHPQVFPPPQVPPGDQPTPSL